MGKIHTVLLIRRFICATSITFIKKLITKITRQQAVAKLQKHFKIFLLIVIFFSFIKYIVHYWIYILILNNIMHACCENGMKIFISKCIRSLALLWHCYSLILDIYFRFLFLLLKLFSFIAFPLNNPQFSLHPSTIYIVCWFKKCCVMCFIFLYITLYKGIKNCIFYIFF